MRAAFSLNEKKSNRTIDDARLPDESAASGTEPHKHPYANDDEPDSGNSLKRCRREGLRELAADQDGQQTTTDQRGGSGEKHAPTTQVFVGGEQQGGQLGLVAKLGDENTQKDRK